MEKVGHGRPECVGSCLMTENVEDSICTYLQTISICAFSARDRDFVWENDMQLSHKQALALATLFFEICTGHDNLVFLVHVLLFASKWL